MGNWKEEQKPLRGLGMASGFHPFCEFCLWDLLNSSYYEIQEEDFIEL